MCLDDTAKSLSAEIKQCHLNAQQYYGSSLTHYTHHTLILNIAEVYIRKAALH